MKLRYDIKSISSNFIRKIVKNVGYNFEKISELETKIIKIKSINNNLQKYNEAKTISKNYPHDPRTQLLLAETMFDNLDMNWIEQIHVYAASRSKWLKDNGLDKINMEFIDPNVVAGSLGNFCSLEALINANLFGIKSKKNIYLLLPKNFKPRNETLFKYFSSYINILKDDEITSSLKKFKSILTVPIGFCLPLLKRSVFLDWIPNLVQQEKTKQNNHEPLLKLSNEDYEKGKSILKKNGLPNDAWYITMHVREPGYRSETKNNTTEKFRSSNPLNYIESIKAVTNAGGWVFRMGDSSMTKLPKMKNVIDYAHSSIKSDFMDIFLAATCKFCIGTSSGYWPIPRYFSVPCILTNTPKTGEYFFLSQKDFFLPRLLRNKKTQKYIKFDEFMAPPISMGVCDNDYLKRGIQWEENQSEELKKVTEEMLERVHKSNNLKEDTNIQKKFKKISENSIYKKTGFSLQGFASISKHFAERYSDLI